ncbi:hypothetical protein JOF53_002146 [Crossiella equi]|uniref:DUF2029 domain-containing protein n=1 Tax=Crossiella equi TaxID=130796 RepID=A0ABS5AAQ3_9PSEU|nr:hypothetical protein [Crossiella equi]MBP2473274.1 hypothetical protein [Crossiella equi]
MLWLPLLFLAVVLYLPRVLLLVDPPPPPDEKWYMVFVDFAEPPPLFELTVNPERGYSVLALLAAYTLAVAALRLRPAAWHCTAFAGVVAVLGVLGGRSIPAAVWLVGVLLFAVSAWRARRAAGPSWWHYPLVTGVGLVALAVSRAELPAVTAAAVLMLLGLAAGRLWLWPVAVLLLVVDGWSAQAPELSLLLGILLLTGASAAVLTSEEAGRPQPTRLLPY